MEENTQKPPVKPPLGMYPARVDDRGRVKLPVDFQQYFAELGETRFFITSLDRTIAQIYPISVWRQNEKFLAEFMEDPDIADNVAFNAADLGGQAELDSQGRLLLPVELRKELGIENSAVRLHARDERVEVLSDAVYEERRQRAKSAGAADVTRLRKAGLK